MQLLFAVKFCGKKPSLKISSAVHLSSIFLWRSSSLAAFLGWYRYHSPSTQPVNAMPSNNGFTPHVLRDGGCFSLFIHFLFKWKELRHFFLRTDECDWGIGLCRRVKRWVSERRRVERTGCAMKDPPILTAFWVCEWKLQMQQAPPPLTWTFFNYQDLFLSLFFFLASSPPLLPPF